MPAGDGADMSELQAQHCMTPEQWIWPLRSVSVVPANKLLLQELKSINRNWAADVKFSKKFLFLVPISREGQLPVLTPGQI